MSSILKDRKISKEHRDKLSAAAKGRKMSDATKQKISDTFQKPEYRNKRCVQVTDGMRIWSSITKCAADIGCAKDTVRRKINAGILKEVK